MEEFCAVVIFPQEKPCGQRCKCSAQKNQKNACRNTECHTLVRTGGSRVVNAAGVSATQPVYRTALFHFARR